MGWWAVFGASPIFGIKPFGDGLVERGPWPIADASDVAMFNRVVMDVMIMIFEIGRIADEMFPKPLLPNAATAGLPCWSAHPRFPAPGSDPFPRETGLDLADTAGEIGITRRQCPDHVQMIWQKDHGRDFESPICPATFDGPAKKRRGGRIRQNRATAGRDHGQKILPAGMIETSVIGPGMASRIDSDERSTEYRIRSR